MVKWIQGRYRRRIVVLGVSGLCSLLLGLLLLGMGNAVAGEQLCQHMAERWSEQGKVSQISCFFSREAAIGEDQIISFEHRLDQALEEASLVSDSENESARLWADAYSATGRITVASNRASVELAAVGIGGDFFQFHPLQLVSGSYFSGNDVLTDYIVLDEDAAWQLFGSNDVAGQIVTVGEIPHVITGVVKREEGRIAEAAGLTATVAYVSYNSLTAYGTSYGLNTYEIVMPNPVSGYAKSYVTENIGVDGVEMEIVENTTRFSLLSRLKLLFAFGTRSMSSKAIIYPYWENMARGYEDILALLAVLMLAAFLYPVVLLVTAAVVAWRHRTWTVRSLWEWLKDKWERFWEKCAQKRRDTKDGGKIGKKEKQQTTKKTCRKGEGL